MSAFVYKEQMAIIGVAFLNGIFIYPYLKRFYRQAYSVKAVPTHFVSLRHTYLK